MDKAMIILLWTLQYILDPKEVYGEDFPSETFRALT